MSQAGSLSIPTIPLPVPSGGTGTSSFNPNGVVISGTTSTSPLSALTLNDGQIVIGSTGNPPEARNITAGAGISITNGANTITIASSGTFTLNYTRVTSADSPYFVLSTDQYLSVDSSGGPVTLNFPPIAATGRAFIVKDAEGTSATNNITLTTSGGTVTFDGSTSRIMNTNFYALNLINNGTNYEVY